MPQAFHNLNNKTSYISFFLLFLFSINSYSQTTLKGNVQSEGEVVAYALVQQANTVQPIYTDSLGNFEITNLTAAETLTINCIGYEEKTVLVKNLNHPLIIELKKNSTLLDEMVIYKINSRWKSFFKKPKPHLWQDFIAVLENTSALVKYTAPKNLSFNGIAFITKNNGIHRTKRLRPLIFKDSISMHTSLIENTVTFHDIRKNNEGKERRKDYRIEFEFPYLIEIKKGDVFYLGLELIPSDIRNIDATNNLMLCTLKQESSAELETAVYPYLFNQQYNKLFYKIIPSQSDLYFELKILED